jgi:hypothetical protein
MGESYPICHVNSPTFSSLLPGGTDHFGFLYHGDLRAFCDELRAQGVRFPVPLKEGVGGDGCVMSPHPTASVSN